MLEHLRIIFSVSRKKQTQTNKSFYLLHNMNIHIPWHGFLEIVPPEAS